MSSRPAVVRLRSWLPQTTNALNTFRTLLLRRGWIPCERLRLARGLHGHIMATRCSELMDTLACEQPSAPPPPSLK